MKEDKDKNKSHAAGYAILLLVALIVILALLAAVFVTSDVVESNHEHTWDDGVETTAATCEDMGTVTYTCTGCGDTKEEAIAPLGHVWESEYTDATCVSAGYTTQVCSRCGAEQSIGGGEATGVHTYADEWDWWLDEDNNVEASLTLVCSVCGYKTIKDPDDIVLNYDGTYTAKVQDPYSPREYYEDTQRMFAGDVAADGTITDVGSGTQYTPVTDEDGNVSYELTQIESTTEYLVVSGYVNGAPVSVADNLLYTNQSGGEHHTSESLVTVVFEEGVVRIGDFAFDGCQSLETVEFPDTLVEIGEDAFADCIMLGSVEIPSSVTTIGKQAFYGCAAGSYGEYTGIESIVLHGNENGTTIGDSAFYKPYALKSVTFDGGVFEIGPYAFDYCVSLASLTIVNGADFTSVGLQAFCDSSGTSPVATVYYDGTGAKWDTIKAVFNASFNNIPSSCKVYYYSATEAHSCWHWSDDGEPVVWDI